MSGKKGRFTLFIVPHSSSKVWSIRLSKTHLGCIAAATAAFALALCVLGSNYLQMLGLMPELTYLREVAACQRQQINALVMEARSLQREIEGLASLDRQVRHLLGTVSLTPGEEAPEVRMASVGGPTAAASLAKAPALDSTLSKDQGAGSLALGSMALMHLEELRGGIPQIEQGLQECRDGLAELQAELRAYPSIWPAPGRVTSGFGYRRSPFGWGTEFHGGIDIASAYGTPIVATADGEVVFNGYRAGYGNTIVIDHGYGYRTLYSHNAQNLVSVGAQVPRGQAIALMGRSGRTTGPHVHYEVHYMGQRVNPKPYLQAP
jgi:hypothetical protein